MVETNKAEVKARPRPRFKWLKRFAAVLVGFLFAGILAEFAVVIVLGEQVKFPRHVVEAEWGLRYNDPGSSYRHKSADGTWYFQINNQGMRADRDYPYEKPEGTIRIVSLGDSFTIGYEVDEEQCFSRVLEQTLIEKGYQVEVLNCGVSGYSNAEALLYLERELLKYDPDIVLQSFYFNDLVDNVRTGLFAMESGKLVSKNERYVPGGGMANYLNSSWFFNLLAGYSNAFAITKEQISLMMKRSLVEQHQENLDAKDKTAAEVEESQLAAAAARKKNLETRQEFAAAILDRMYATCTAQQIPLVIQSIPAGDGLTDVFPGQAFDASRPGVYLLSTKPLFEELPKETLVYNQNSHGHWTPIGHELSGKALAELMVREGLLGR
ncbi:MAG: SGNH/GDSL hydrolase family protein [Planctomycetota bacterium]|jgi:lysophospholipase L1-like esterase